MLNAVAVTFPPADRLRFAPLLRLKVLVFCRVELAPVTLTTAFVGVVFAVRKLVVPPFSIVIVFPAAQLSVLPTSSWPPLTVISPLAFKVPVNAPAGSPT